jgi:hypothetical protein
MTSPSDGYPDNNPKTAIGVSKAPLHFIPPVALVHLGLAMENGGAKYGLMNWREFTVSSSVYYDAALRHLLAWWDGEDAAPDSKVHHLAHVMACCAIILDAAESTRLNDDRPDIDGQVVPLLDRLHKARSAALARATEDLAGLAARENMHGAPTPKPPADANNDLFKDIHPGNQPKPGTPRMRQGLSVIAGTIYFEDTPILDLHQLNQLHPSQRDRLVSLINGIDGDPEPVRRREADEGSA